MKIEIDEDHHIITIAGVRYTYEYFTALGSGGIMSGIPFSLERREDGAIIVERLSRERAAELFDVLEVPSE